MFTGIIEEVGAILSLKKNADGALITVCATKVLEGTRLGDSISVDGVCLTVEKIDSKSFSASVMNETLRSTKLGLLKSGDKVNLERAATLSTRLGGHIVTGHTDGVGIVERVKDDGAAKLLTVSVGRTSVEKNNLLRFIATKGSVALDGVSLTVASVDDKKGEFSLSLVRHTQVATTLLSLKVREKVNIETDVLAKYTARALEMGGSS